MTISVLINYSKSNSVGKNPKKGTRTKGITFIYNPYLIYKTYLYRIITATLIAGSYNCNYGA